MYPTISLIYYPKLRILYTNRAWHPGKFFAATCARNGFPLSTLLVCRGCMTGTTPLNYTYYTTPTISMNILLHSHYTNTTTHLPMLSLRFLLKISKVLFIYMCVISGYFDVTNLLLPLLWHLPFFLLLYLLWLHYFHFKTSLFSFYDVIIFILWRHNLGPQMSAYPSCSQIPLYLRPYTLISLIWSYRAGAKTQLNLSATTGKH